MIKSVDDSAERVVVVGAGLGGLAAACTLAARGYDVTVFEKNPWLGGKAAILESNGFRFDMGPTILTVPAVLKRIFAEAGRSMGDYLDLIPLDPQWRCFFDEGNRLDLWADVPRMVESINQFSKNPNAGAGYAKFIDLSQRLHKISEEVFFWRNIGKITDTFQPGKMFDLPMLQRVLELRMGRSVAGTVRSMIPDPQVSQLVDHFVQYVGSAPDESPAVLCGIAHMQTDGGVWYPRGGTGAVPAALYKLGTELGVQFRHGTGIRRIQTANSRVTGVETDTGEVVPASLVVSNADTVRMHRELMTPAEATSFAKERKYEPACSGVVLYLGLKRRYEQLLHHNFVFSRDPHEEFETIYRKGQPAPDPTCYVCAPAITEPEVAPPGGEALYVLVHTPYLRPGQNWTEMLPGYRQVILDKLARTAGMEDLQSQIVFEQALTPAGIEERYRVLNGAIYGLASHGKFLGAFKPANRHRRVKGLYMAGGSAHPGPGMPMVMMSGWIAADTLDRDLRPDVGTPAAVAAITTLSE